MTQPYLIALDLDGTLLTNDRRITTYTKTTIQKLVEMGHIVVIATGRSKRMSILYYDQLGLNTPLINSNGAVIHHPYDQRWGIHHVPLDYKTAKNIVEISYSLNSKNILAVIQDNVLIDRFDEHIVNFYDEGAKDVGQILVGPLLKKLQENPTLMMVYPDVNHLDTFTKQLNDIHADVVDHRNWGAPFHIIEIMNKQTNKGKAIKKVADHYFIPRERIIAFGDELNDLHMIEYAGVGVAVGNAVAEVKAVADYVTKTNEEDGVAVFLDDYFKLSQSAIIS